MRADAQANRQAILAAARQLYAERGADVPFAAVAATAGVGIATLYRHFPTPLDLTIGVATGLLEEYRALADDAIPLMKQDPAKGWRWFIDQVVALNPASFMPQIASGLDPHHLPPTIVSTRNELIAVVDEVLAVAKKAGLVAKDVDALRFHLGICWVSRPMPDIVETFLPGQQAWLVEVFLRGIAG